MDNHTTITGNLTGDPELRYTKNERAVATVGIAVNRRWTTDGTEHEEVSFFDVVAWGDLGEHLAGSAGKGDRVTVTGRLQQQRWETDEGDARSRVQIVANDIAASMRFAQVKIMKIAKDDAA